MKSLAGRVLSPALDNEPVRGCTVSQKLTDSCYVFSLAGATDISAECYEYSKLISVNSGEAIVAENGRETRVLSGESYITARGVPVGVKAEDDCVYTEISLRKESKMNEMIKAGEVFKMASLIPYREGRIVNADLINDEKLKLVVMSFDEGTGLSEHAAPGEALVFALEGEADIGYEGEVHRLHAGETFKFDKLGRHSVKPAGKFKMALLLVLD